MTCTLSHAKAKRFNHSCYLERITCSNGTKTLITRHKKSRKFAKPSVSKRISNMKWKFTFINILQKKYKLKFLRVIDKEINLSHAEIKLFKFTVTSRKVSNKLNGHSKIHNAIYLQLPQ